MSFMPLDGTVLRAIQAAVVAILIAAALVLILRPFAARIQLLDEPGGRKTHNGQVPIVGGLAILGGFIIASWFSAELGHPGRVLLGASAFMALVGLLDDRFELPPIVRLFAQIAAAIALMFGTSQVVADLGDLINTGNLELGWLALPFTVVACVALVNAINMLDGLDGLAGGVALSASLALAALALGAGHSAIGVMALSLAGATFAFLLFNMPTQFNRKLRIFMGDSGSLLLGFALAGISLALIQSGGPDVSPAVILWTMPIPIFELFSTTARRLMQGLPPTHADDRHFHHRLVNSGFSVRLVFVLYATVSVLSASVGIVADYVNLADPVLFGGFVVFYVGWLVFVRLSPQIGRLLPQPWRRDFEVAIH